MMTKWIDADVYGEGPSKVGEVGYLVERIDENNCCATSYALYMSPQRTNRSREPRLTGWCGTTNNICKNACGVWRVVRVNHAGDRIQIARLNGVELDAFLRESGYPELVPAVEAEASEVAVS